MSDGARVGLHEGADPRAGRRDGGSAVLRNRLAGPRSTFRDDYVAPTSPNPPARCSFSRLWTAQ